MDVLIQSLVQANFAPERIIPRASMAQYTTFRVGGIADVLVNIASADEIPVALSAAKKADVPVTIIGCGSNLLVRDGGIRGLVLRISSAMSAIRRVGDDLIAEAGAPLGAIAAFARDEGLCGMAELAGIPGTDWRRRGDERGRIRHRAGADRFLCGLRFAAQRKADSLFR